MADAASPVEENAIFQDSNFEKLIAAGVDVAEMTALIEEHAPGYSSKKRLHDGLKDFLKKVADAEQREYVVKQVGKAKAQMVEGDKMLTTLFSSVKLKEKSAAVNTILETMIENGSLTRFEKKSVVDNIRTRIQKAKDGGKPKVVEKLDGMLTQAVKASGDFTLPVNNIKELHRLTMEIYQTAEVPKAKGKDAPDPAKAKRDLQEKAARKPALERQYDALEATSAMWFETTIEFKPRLAEAIAGFVEAEKKRKAKEEEEAFAKKVIEEEQAVIRKKEEAAKRELEMEKAIDEQLKARRAEAALKPVVEVVKVVKERKVLPPKPKAKATDALAQDAEASEEIWETLARQKAEQEAEEAARLAAEAEEAARIAAEEEAAWLAENEAWEKEQAEAEAQKQAEIARLKKQLDQANKSTKEQDAALKHLSEKQKAEKAAAEAAAKIPAKPSVSLMHAGAAKAAPEVAAPKPRPVRKAPVAIAPKWGAPVPLVLNDNGGDLLERLAAQEATQKAERAAKALAAEQEAAREAAAEEAAWIREQAAWEKEKKEKEAEKEAERARLKKQLDQANSMTKQDQAVFKLVTEKQKAEKAAAEAAAKKTAKPSVSLVRQAEAAAPKARPVRKAPVAVASKWGAPPVCDFGSEDLLDKLAAQEAAEKAEKEERATKVAENAWAAGAEGKEEEEEEATEEAPAAAAPAPQVVATKKVDSPSSSLAESLMAHGPSLAEAAKAPKKVAGAGAAAANPQKKKKAWGKIDANLVGFDANNPNM